jgi:FkbM family methyltransferase
MGSMKLLARVPVVRGALRGRWWLPAGGGKVWRVLGGTYEPEQTLLFERRVKPGDVVLDLGAHIGYYTLLAAGLIGPRGRVFAFEPHPRNAWYLRQHVRMNRCGNVEVVEQAAYDRTGAERFDPGSGTGTGRVTRSGAISVRAVRLDDFVAERGVIPTVVKIDVEGGERAVLDGGAEVLRRCRPVIFLSTHGNDRLAACRRALSMLGYRTLPIRDGRGAGDLVCIPEERAQPLAAGQAVAS